MENITDAIMLKDTAKKSHIALVYGIGGIVIGSLFLTR